MSLAFPNDDRIQSILDRVVADAMPIVDGKVADYIPELANTPTDLCAIAVHLCDGRRFHAGNAVERYVTLQSVSKLVVLIGLLEELGAEHVFEWVLVEPSGDNFASLARLDQFGPKPSNPMLNAGAITLCSHIPGINEEQYTWVSKWMQICFGEKLNLNPTVFASERRTGDRNRSLAYLLKSTGNLVGNVDEILDAYFALCSYDVTVRQASYLAYLLANLGADVNGQQILSKHTVQQVLTVMGTCGLYNESGTFMMRTGMFAKSGVSGLLLASIPHVGGIVTFSPLINAKGTSVRGMAMLSELHNELGWHFAA